MAQNNNNATATVGIGEQSSSIPLKAVVAVSGKSKQ